MNTKHALALGFALGLVIALSPSCGPGTPQCAPSNCDGCCDALGNCQSGTSSTSCGTGANACVSCATGQACVQGRCANGCGPSNCTGCCAADGSCKKPGFGATSKSACGVNGAACKACSNTQQCNAAGQCTACTGCMDADGGCQPGTADTACGTGGAACRSCGANQSCQSNACATRDAGTPDAGNSDAGSDAGSVDAGSIDAGAVGMPCTRDSDCTPYLGSGALCRLWTTPPDGGFPYPGGYCTLDCTNASCPGDTQCVGTGGFFGEQGNLCWATCVDDFSCRLPDYACYGGLPDGGNLGCWINPPAPAGLEGAPCDAGTDCGPPPVTGFCFPDTLADGGPSGFVGGYCMADCTTAGDELCGDGGICSWQGSYSLCLGACGTPDGTQQNCRAGYACAPNALPDGGVDTRGICLPSPPPPPPSNLIANGSFEADTNAPPSGWTMIQGGTVGVLTAMAGGTGTPPPAEDGTNVATFASLISSSFREAASTCFPFQGGQPLTFTGYVLTTQPVTNSKASFKIFYFSDGACTTPASPAYQTQTSFTLQAQNTWQLNQFNRTAAQVPADGGSAFVAIRAELTSSGIPGDIYFDHIVVTQP